MFTISHNLTFTTNYLTLSPPKSIQAAVVYTPPITYIPQYSINIFIYAHVFKSDCSLKLKSFKTKECFVEDEFEAYVNVVGIKNR